MTSLASSCSDGYAHMQAIQVNTPAGVRFESVTAAHAEALQRLFECNAKTEVAESFDPFALTAERALQIAIELRRDGYYVLSRDGRLLGFSMLRGADEGYEIPSFGIFIDHACHGQGLGRILTTRTIEEARHQGAPAVRLSVYSDNRVAHRLYESLGFVEVERLPSKAEIGDGASGGKREKIVMRLELGG